MGLYDFSFYDLIVRNAVAFADCTCWREIDDGRQLTFLDYKNRVDQLADGLSNIGIQKGDRLGVVGKNSLEFFLIYGAAAALGAIVLPVNWRLSPEEMTYNLNDCQAKIVFVDAEFQQPLATRRGDLPTVTTFYNLKADLGEEVTFASLLHAPTEFARTDVASSDGFVIIHTAAVAGRPRGALLSHGNILLAGMHFNYYLGLSTSDVHLNLLPLFHVAGLFMATSCFHAGAVNLNISKFEAKSAVKLIVDSGVSLLFDFPPILDSLLKAAVEEHLELRSLRGVVGLGTQATIEEFQKTTGGRYYVMYGQTETSCLTSMGQYSERPGSAGKVVMMADVQLVDDHGHPVALGEIGEITVKGPMVFMGYWDLPKDNAHVFRDGWHHTGDLGRFDEQGFLFYAGRKAEKELIKPGGENVYPAEVEKVILQHPAVAKTVVIGVPDPKWKEGIKAVCQLHEGKELAAKELIRFVGERIASFKKPQYVEFVAALPLKGDGSLDRDAVKSLYGKG
ncbi:MAG: AMP-binding protein [Proteobacteria bacterium]|nr:AMP-binding protein [Pseudomonadota bacterium]